MVVAVRHAAVRGQTNLQEQHTSLNLIILNIDIQEKYLSRGVWLGMLLSQMFSHSTFNGGDSNNERSSTNPGFNHDPDLAARWTPVRCGMSLSTSCC